MHLRVIAGKLGSRWFDSPNSVVTHPMGERVRGALFNALGSVEGMAVLDPFAGSGALAFEAISRGATLAVAIERDRRAQSIIEKNIEQLDVGENVTLFKGSVTAWSERNPDALFELILCDPPYNDIQLSTVSRLIRHLKDNGLMVLSYPGRDSAPTVNGVVVVDKSWYGNAALAYYRKAA